MESLLANQITLRNYPETLDDWEVQGYAAILQDPHMTREDFISKKQRIPGYMEQRTHNIIDKPIRPKMRGS